MAKKSMNQLKLGVFVITGLAFLILLLYVIGRNQNLFGKTFVLKARFDNVQGLMRGNNIRFGGMDAGTVSSVDVLNDTTFEVTLLIKKKFQKYIHNNAVANITTDGLMGNKLINIVPVKTPAPLVKERDILFGSKSVDTEQMLEVLNNTNNDIAFIAEQLKQTTQRINDSKVLWTVLNDESLPGNLKVSLSGIKSAAANFEALSKDLRTIIADVKKGNGTIGELLTDSTISVNIDDAIEKIKSIGMVADTLSGHISTLVGNVNNAIDNGKGTFNALLKDEKIKNDVARSIYNIEQGTKAFNENMDAIKHSFLLRGYFKRLKKQKEQDSSPSY